MVRVCNGFCYLMSSVAVFAAAGVSFGVLVAVVLPPQVSSNKINFRPSPPSDNSLSTHLHLLLPEFPRRRLRSSQDSA
jgi:hypothetical protein